MNNDKKPSRKHDWTSTELHLIAFFHPLPLKYSTGGAEYKEDKTELWQTSSYPPRTASR